MMKMQKSSSFPILVDHGEIYAARASTFEVCYLPVQTI